MQGGSGSARQGFPDEGRRQFSLNPYALPTVIVLMPAAGFQSPRSHSAEVHPGVYPGTLSRYKGSARHCKRRVEAIFSRGGHSHCSATNVRMRRDGPPRMAARSTWSGRERSSHSRFPPVPRVGLVTFLFVLLLSRSFSGAASPVFLLLLPANRVVVASP